MGEGGDEVVSCRGVSVEAHVATDVTERGRGEETRYNEITQMYVEKASVVF